MPRTACQNRPSVAGTSACGTCVLQETFFGSRLGGANLPSQTIVSVRAADSSGNLPILIGFLLGASRNQQDLATCARHGLPRQTTKGL